MARYHVSVTGLRLKNRFHVLLFWRHAMPSYNQAREADGNVLTDALKRNGVHHTLTVWESEAAMKRFLYRGAHRKAIKTFPKIATGTTWSYASDEIPSWPDALAQLEANGKTYAAPK